MRLLRTLALILLAAAGAGAQTTITDTIRLGDTTLASGQILISWEPFTTSGGIGVVGGQFNHTFSGGALSLVLYPNAGATPAGTSYTARFSFDNGSTTTEFWVVPASSPSTLGDIRVSSPPTPSTSVNLTQLTQGGATDGQCATWSNTNSQWEAGSCGGSTGITCGATPDALTIVSGVLTITGSACFTVNTEASAATDDIDTIECTAGWRFELLPIHDSRTAILKQSAAILMRQDFYLDNVGDRWLGFCHATDVVSERSRSDNGG